MTRSLAQSNAESDLLNHIDAVFVRMFVPGDVGARENYAAIAREIYGIARGPRNLVDELTRPKADAFSSDAAREVVVSHDTTRDEYAHEQSPKLPRVTPTRVDVFR